VEPNERALMRRLSRALMPTFESDVQDVALAAKITGSPRELGLILGAQVRHGRRLEHLLRDTIKDLSPGERELFAIKLNHASHGKDRVHLLTMASGPLTNSYFLALREDVVLVSSRLPLLKEALDGLGQPPLTSTAPLQLEMSMNPLVLASVAGQSVLRNPKELQAIVQAANSGEFDRIVPLLPRMFAGAVADYEALTKELAHVDLAKTRMRLSLQGGATLRLRLEVPTECLRLVAPVLAQARKLGIVP
jgi:hypothetical protein